jgi:hypothetical protein
VATGWWSAAAEARCAVGCSWSLRPQPGRAGTDRSDCAAIAYSGLPSGAPGFVPWAQGVGVRCKIQWHGA